MRAKGPWISKWHDTDRGDGKPGPWKRVWYSMHPASMGRRALNAAVADLGYKESPPGSNSTKFGRHWKQDGVPWCGMAVARWWQQAGFTIPRELALKIDYVPELLNLATNKRHRLSLIHKNRVRAGDAVLYDFPRQDGVADHVGLFEKWIDKKAGTFYAIEGNTGNISQSNGGEVMRRRRDMSSVIAFVRKLPG